MDPRDPLDRTVFVTGAARGIGADLARRLVRAGARVTLLDIDEGVQEAADRLGAHALGVVADVRRPDELARAVARTADRFGGPDVVVANAATISPQDLVSGDADAVARTIDVNLTGAWNTVRAAAPHLRPGIGYALMVCSTAAFVRTPHYGAYAASKAGLDAVTDVLRIELSPRAIRVGTAYFHAVDTATFHETVDAPALERFTSGMPTSAFRTVAVARASRALVRAIARRSRRVVVPTYAGGVLVAPGVAQVVFEAFGRLTGALPSYGEDVTGPSSPR
jgi:NAD(P)-dependent dehydrogenase (short-subunit alcohol dehydrogenase family)